ncbi:type II toxin-antitoxin system PemK/MazF family toxin [Candidatus Saccharibacteria bacterium]|nr:type II toxin-antitoxin system PemK/MazF family toxin [Candidatus Saccharibacteria bacterium]
MDKSNQKDFNGWMKLKEKIHYSGSTFSIREGEIWWCAIGENVGNEICGKGLEFSRPVVIVRKLSRENFIGVPLTSKRHVGSWYVEFTFKDKKQYAVVAQVENISTNRLYDKIGELPEEDLKTIQDGLKKLF